MRGACEVPIWTLYGAKIRVLWRLVLSCVFGIQESEDRMGMVSWNHVPGLLPVHYVAVGEAHVDAGEYRDNRDDICIGCCAAAQSQLRSLAWTMTLCTIR